MGGKNPRFLRRVPWAFAPSAARHQSQATVFVPNAERRGHKHNTAKSRAEFDKLTYIIIAKAPEKFAALMKREYRIYAKVIKAANIPMQGVAWLLPHT